MPVPVEVATGLMDAFSNFGDRINPDIARQVLFSSAGFGGSFGGRSEPRESPIKEPIVVSDEIDYDSLNEQLRRYIKAKEKHPPYGKINWYFDDD